MIKYIKLGPIGDLFNSDILGIYLKGGNSTPISNDLLYSRLKAFVYSGFLVEISKVEHDNLSLVLNNARNIPLVVVPISKSTSIEPVEAVLNTPPPTLYVGNRFLIWKKPTGEWEGREQQIVEYTDTGWVYTIPTNGLSLPVYKWGISLKYKGTYPSGYWLFDESLLSEETLVGGTEEEYDDYAYRLFLLAEKNRKDGDDELAKLIEQLRKKAIWAKEVGVEDVKEFWKTNNVELVLQEVGMKFKAYDLILEKLKGYMCCCNENCDCDQKPVPPTGPEVALPYIPPTVELSLTEADNFTNNIYHYKYGYNYSPDIVWNVLKQTNSIINSSLSHTLTPFDPISEDGGSGSIKLDVTLDTDGNTELVVDDGQQIVTRIATYKFIKPILVGAIDLSNVGLIGEDLWNLLKVDGQIYDRDLEIKYNFLYTDKIMVIAIPASLGIPKGIYDRNGLLMNASFSLRTNNITTNGLARNYTTSYNIYEYRFINSVSGIWTIKF